MYKRMFKFELQLSSYWQNIKFLRYCPKFHIFTNIVIFKVYLQLFRPTASFLLNFYGRDLSRIFFFFFANCERLKLLISLFENDYRQFQTVFRLFKYEALVKASVLKCEGKFIWRLIVTFIYFFVLFYKPWRPFNAQHCSPMVPRWPCSLETAGPASLSPRLAWGAISKENTQSKKHDGCNLGFWCLWMAHIPGLSRGVTPGCNSWQLHIINLSYKP